MSGTYDSAVATAIANTQKESIDSQIVTKTLDTLNQNAPKSKSKSTGGNMAASYDFQKSVLGAVYGTTGAIADIKS